MIEIWSAVSAAILLLVVAALVFFNYFPWWGALLVALAGYLFIESALRQRLTQLMLRVVLVLAFISVVLLVWNYHTEVVVLAVVGLALFLLIDNVREVIGR